MDSCMKRRARRIAVPLLVLLANLAGPVVAMAQETRSLDHQGVARSYIVTNQAASGSGPKPLLIILHGRRQPADPNRSFPDLDALATREGFVAVYPSAVDGKWNYVGEAEPLSRAGGEIVDDLGFVRRLIDQLVERKIADPERIYVSGTSQGAFLTYSILCGLADRIAGAAALLASMTDVQIAACRPVRAVPALVIAGTNDRVVRYDGWLSPEDRLTSVPETMEFWRRQHGCTGQKDSVLPKKVEANPTRSVLVEWTGCRIEGALRLYRVQGGGHRLPSINSPSPVIDPRFGQRSQDFETADEVWSFLKPLRRAAN